MSALLDLKQPTNQPIPEDWTWKLVHRATTVATPVPKVHYAFWRGHDDGGKWNSLCGMLHTYNRLNDVQQISENAVTLDMMCLKCKALLRDSYSDELPDLEKQREAWQELEKRRSEAREYMQDRREAYRRVSGNGEQGIGAVLTEGFDKGKPPELKLELRNDVNKELLDASFGWPVLTTEQELTCENISKAYRELAANVMEAMPRGRERNQALNALQSSMQWAHSAVIAGGRA